MATGQLGPAVTSASGTGLYEEKKSIAGRVFDGFLTVAIALTLLYFILLGIALFIYDVQLILAHIAH